MKLQDLIKKLLETTDTSATDPTKFVGPPVNTVTGEIIPPNEAKGKKKKKGKDDEEDDENHSSDEVGYYSDDEVHDVTTKDDEETIHRAMLVPSAKYEWQGFQAKGADYVHHFGVTKDEVVADVAPVATSSSYLQTVGRELNENNMMKKWADPFRLELANVGLKKGYGISEAIKRVQHLKPDLVTPNVADMAAAGAASLATAEAPKKPTKAAVAKIARGDEVVMGRLDLRGAAQSTDHPQDSFQDTPLKDYGLPRESERVDPKLPHGGGNRRAVIDAADEPAQEAIFKAVGSMHADLGAGLNPLGGITAQVSDRTKKRAWADNLHTLVNKNTKTHQRAARLDYAKYGDLARELMLMRRGQK